MAFTRMLNDPKLSDNQLSLRDINHPFFSSRAPIL